MNALETAGDHKENTMSSRGGSQPSETAVTNMGYKHTQTKYRGKRTSKLGLFFKRVLTVLKKKKKKKKDRM